MKRIAVILPALLAIGIVSYQMYDHYFMSRDLRRSLMAVCDSHTTWADGQQYMREARVQVRTARDREVFKDFQSAVADLFQYSHCDEDLQTALGQINLNTQNLQIHFEAGLLGPRGVIAEKKSIGAQIDAAKSTYDRCRGLEHEAQTALQAVRDRYRLSD